MTNFTYSKIITFLMIIFFSLFVVLGLFSVAVMDDFWHAHFISKNFNPFSPLVWAYGQYINWTGRILISLIQGISSFPPLYTNLMSSLNAILFLTCFYAYFYKQKIRMKLSIDYIYVMLLIIFIICYPVLGESVFWAASVYIAPLILFLVCLNLLESDSIYDLRSWKYYLLFFCLGNSIELLVIPMLILLWTKRYHLKRSTWIYISCFFSLGFLVSFLAPGNISHLSHAEHDFSLNLISLFKQVFLIYKKGFSFFGVTLLLIIPLILSLRMNKELTALFLRRQFLTYQVISLSSLIFLIPIYGFSADRTYLYFLLFQGMALFWGLQYLKIKLDFLYFFEKIERPMVVITTLICILVLVFNISDAKLLRESFIDQQQKMVSVDKLISVSQMKKPMSKHLLFYSDCTPNKDSWLNVAMAKYYGLSGLTCY